MERWITVKGRHVLIDDEIGMEKSVKYFYRNKSIGRITRSERNEVTHAINTDCNIYRNGSKYRIGGNYYKCYGNYVYYFAIKDYNDYIFFKKVLIRGKER